MNHPDPVRETVGVLVTVITGTTALVFILWACQAF
jgi:hypothetical protein